MSAVRAMSAAAAVFATACALQHTATGTPDTGGNFDDVAVDRSVLDGSDVPMAPDGPDVPIVALDTVDDDGAVTDAPDVPTPVDVPLDIPMPVDIPVPTDVPPDRITMIDVPPPIDIVDVPPRPDVPPPMDVPPATTPAGSACTAGTTTCASGADCFSYGAGGNFCADCGGYGDRACPGSTCREGSYDSTSDSCIHSVGSHTGQPGGSCGSSADCGSLGQCVRVAGGSGRACLACGGVGQACCCPTGYLPSCTCTAGATTCTAVGGTYWTVCR